MNIEKISLGCEITKTKMAFFIAFLIIFVFPFWLASERQTVTSYYPSPYGTYDKLYGGKGKIGKQNFFLEVGRGSRNIGGNILTDVDYFYSNTQLYIRSDNGILNLSPRGQIVTFLPDRGNSYAPYVRNFCEWKNGACPAQHSPIARGRTKGRIAYGDNNRPFRLCCQITIN